MYPESCPVGVLIKSLKKEKRIYFSSLAQHLARSPAGKSSSVKDRFPGFPGIPQFMSTHAHIFIQVLDDAKFQEKMKKSQKGVSRADFCNVSLNNPACHHVISDEQFTKICALVEEVNGNHRLEQLQGSRLEHVASSQPSQSQSQPLAAGDLNMAPVVDERHLRTRSESNLSTTSTDIDPHRGLHLPQPSIAEQIAAMSYQLNGMQGFGQAQGLGLGQGLGHGLGQGLGLEQGYLGSDGSRPDCSSDEAIAQSMGQFGLEETTTTMASFTSTTEMGIGGDERLGGGILDPNDPPESWEQAASGKKKGKNKGRGSTEGTANGAAGAVSAGSTEMVSKDARSSLLVAREKQLAEELMGMTHGRYFEFNDTTVTPMPLRNLEKSFEGKESAYILVYRKQLDQPSSTAHPLTKVPPPAYWAEKAIEENQALKLQREQYNAQSHTAIVRFLCPGHLRFKDPLLEIDQPVVSMVPGLPKEWSHFIDLSVDLRNSLDDVKANFLKTCRAHVMGLGLLADPLEPGSDQTILSKLVISNLDKYGEGYHPSMPLGSGSNAAERGSGSIGDFISESATLLVWNGKSIGGANVHAGMTRRVTHSFLCFDCTFHLSILLLFDCNWSSIHQYPLISLSNTPSSTSLSHSQTRILQSHPIPFPTLPTFAPHSSHSSFLSPTGMAGMPLKVSFTFLRLAEQTGSFAVSVGPVDKNDPTQDPTQAQWSSEKVEEMYHRRIGTNPSLRTPSPVVVVNPASHLAALQTRKAIPLVAVAETKDVWMASTTSLTNVCTKISNSFGALLTGGASRACVHVVENTLSGNKGFNLSFDDSQAAQVTSSSDAHDATSAIANGGVTDTKGLTAVLVWSSGPLRAGSARKVQELDQRVLCSIESREFYVEDVEGRGMHAMHLAEVDAPTADADAILINLAIDAL